MLTGVEIIKSRLKIRHAAEISAVRYVKSGVPHKKISVEGDFAYIKFVGIDTVEVAETYRGKNLYANRSVLPKLSGDRVYIADIMGADVIVDGDIIGELVDVLQYGSADVYVVKLKDRSGTVNFPALKEVVRSYDIENGEIILDGRFFSRVAVYND